MKFFLLLASVVFLHKSVLAEKIINCYYGTWAHYRTGNGNFETSHIDPNLCTHLSYSFFGITDNSEIRILDPWLDDNLGNIRKVNALKQENPKLKTLAVVGGWNEGSIKYSTMAANPVSRARFITSAVNFVRQWGFDGLDLDWEYPAQREGLTVDRVNFVTLLRELKAALSQYGLILGIAVGASQTTASISYNIPEIVKHVDFVNVMTYDFSTSWDGVLGYNAPLGGVGEKNVEASINYWLQQGAPPAKLILGIGLYGRSFELAINQQIATGATSTGAGAAGPYTKEAGFLGYNEICESLSVWTEKWDAQASVPYAHRGNQWVGYDNPRSVELKMDFLKRLNLGGAMVWSIETDDFRGACGSGKYPLLKTINRSIGGSSTVPSGTTVAPVTTTTTKSSSGNGGGGNCSVDGYFRNSADCTRYFWCVSGVRFDYQCGNDLYFDPAISTCNWREQVACNI